VTRSQTLSWHMTLKLMLGVLPSHPYPPIWARWVQTLSNESALLQPFLHGLHHKSEALQNIRSHLQSQKGGAGSGEWEPTRSTGRTPTHSVPLSRSRK